VDGTAGSKDVIGFLKHDQGEIVGLRRDLQAVPDERITPAFIEDFKKKATPLCDAS
jgi:hypothetical protein